MNERSMKIQRVEEACHAAQQKIRVRDWEEALYHAEEMRALIASLEFEDRMERQRAARRMLPTQRYSVRRAK